jgi:hypothetical protein
MKGSENKRINVREGAKMKGMEEEEEDEGNGRGGGG